ncbi:BTB/POZ domain containing protein [Brugia malayi]|uniref:BTB/POZ domain containing protein n=1 Tax=Brugia malayi TaxID=6279 RepID=A0A0H5SP39_BRUMA|nr:BTB/POZ domain containing protein [Brugia malayi]CRZ25402.1 Bm4276 [Brugia malayi]VIO95407.1 BTB/POZ domain containing protein [Brugia malayi]
MAMSDEELFVGDENDSNSKTPAHEADPHDAAMQQQGEVLPNPPSNNASEASSSGAFLTNNNSNLNVAGSSSISSANPGQSGTNIIPQKRLFSPNNSACTGVTHRPSVDLSACGSEFARSSDDAIRHDSKTEGSIKLNISNMGALRQKVTTSFHTIANLPWRLAAKTECTKRTSNVKFFSVYIDCNPESESTLWSCDAIVEFRLISQKADTPNFSRQFTNKFNYNSNNWGFPSFMEWSEILNVDKGFIRGDRVVVEAHITVQKVVGVRKNPTFDFTIPQPHTSDGVLVIDGIRLHVSKAYLALYSPVFHAMFFSKFSERDKKEITVEDVILDEFIELLSVVYPSHKPVSAENVEFLLELGDKFEIQFVIDECERFLMRSDDIAVVTKLVWADQYCLAKLQDVCVRTFKQPADIKALKQTEEYKNLSDTTKAALLEKIFKLL